MACLQELGAQGSLAYANIRRRRCQVPKGGFPKIRGAILGVIIIRTIVFGGLYQGPLVLGNYQMKSPKPPNPHPLRAQPLM